MWHDNLQHLPHKGSITITAGSTSFASMVANYAENLQPIVNFAVSIIGVISGLIAMVVGWCALKEKRQSIKNAKELHELEVKKLKIEIQHEQD